MIKFNINGEIIKTRVCKKSDYNFVFGLVKKTIFPYVAKYFKPSKQMFDERFAKDYNKRVLLIKGKKRIGFYQLIPKDNKLDITGIFLSQTYQNKGIGRYLMHYFETLGYKKLELQVWENNPAYHFYKKIGYEVISKNQHKYLMKKIIN